MVHQDAFDGRKSSAGSTDTNLLLALLLSLLAALPLLVGPGIVNTRAGGDSPFLLQRVHQLSQNLRGGIFPARWMPEGAYGLGYPAFSFYAAFPYYIAALLNWAGCGLLWGIKLTQTLGFIGAGLATYRLAQSIGASRGAALLASASYTFAPFHLVNVYVRGDSLSEFYALALYPLIIWALLRLCRRPSPEHVALLAGSYALLVLSHNVSALVFSPLVGLWLLVKAVKQGGREGIRTLGAGTIALGLGLLLSIWFWGPALRERPLVQLGEQTTGYFHYAGHFLSTDLVQPLLIHDYAIGKHRDPFNMGLFQALLAVVGLIALGLRAFKKQRVATSHLVALLALLGYTWLMTPTSAWVWEHVPLLVYTQFPWRLLSVQALAIGLVATNIVDLGKGRMAQSVGLALAALATIAGLAGIHPDRLPLREGDITPLRLMLYETYSGNIGGTIRHEYLPREMVPRPHTSAVQLNGGAKPAPLALEGRLASARLVQRTPTTETWEIEVSETSLLAFHTTFYPGWEATVDGASQGVEPLVGLGLIGLRLSPGAHRVTLRFGHTAVRRYASWASLVGLLLWLVLILYPCRRSRCYRRGALILASIALLAVIWLILVPSPKDQPQAKGPPLMDFGRAPYLHGEPGGITLGPAHLLDYALSASRPKPGEKLYITTAWQGAQPDTLVRAELVAATAHLFRPNPVWAETSAPINGRQVEFVLNVPEDIPPGLYVLRLGVSQDGHERPIRTIEGQEMTRLALQPIQIVASRRATGQERVLGVFGPEGFSPVIALVDAQMHLSPKDLLEVALTWRSERQAPLNYMLSLRLNRADGSGIVSRDLPPLLGGYPTSLWQPGELVTDRVLLSLPEGVGAGFNPVPTRYTLEVVLYDRMTLKAMGTATVEGISPS